MTGIVAGTVARPASRNTPTWWLRIGPVLLLTLLGLACVELSYTDDGVAIVPFDPHSAPDTLLSFGRARMRLEFEAWTNRMPGPAPPASRQGFPLNVLVRLTPIDASAAKDSFLAPAVTLWTVGGDSLLAALALVGTDGGAPWVHAGSAAPTELMVDPARPRWLGGPPGRPCSPRLLCTMNGRSIMIGLPQSPITAAY